MIYNVKLLHIYCANKNIHVRILVKISQEKQSQVVRHSVEP